MRTKKMTRSGRRRAPKVFRAPKRKEAPKESDLNDAAYGKGAKLLRLCGWRDGEGLGKRKDGIQLDALLDSFEDATTDARGLGHRRAAVAAAWARPQEGEIERDTAAEAPASSSNGAWGTSAPATSGWGASPPQARGGGWGGAPSAQGGGWGGAPSAQGGGWGGASSAQGGGWGGAPSAQGGGWGAASSAQGGGWGGSGRRPEPSRSSPTTAAAESSIPRRVDGRIVRAPR